MCFWETIFETLLLCPMGKILALDYGKKRTGLAETDPLQLIATGLTTVATNTLFLFLENYFSKENISLVLVGEPKQKDGSPSEIESEIQQFLKQFKAQFPHIKLQRVDERYTSKIAAQTLLQSGAKKKKRQDKALLDTISATLILQTYLQAKPIL